MKQTTILINNRVDHILNFERNPESIDALDSYILENNGGKILLFGFYHENGQSGRYIYQRNDGQKPFELKGLSVIEAEAKEGVEQLVMTLDLVTPDYKKDLDVKMEKNYFDAKHSYVKFNAKSDICYSIDVIVKIHEMETETIEVESYDKFVLHIAPKENIYDLVLDYGSEASQMLLHQRSVDRTTINDIVPLFELFKNSSANVKTVKNDEFLQYDSDDRRFYRSVFLAKKELAPSHERVPYGCDFLENEDYKLLCKASELDTIRKEYFTVPNIKIAGHGGVEVPAVRINGISNNLFNFEHNYFYRSFVNAFLSQALSNINPNRDNKPRFLNLFILMPNIYSQKEIIQNLEYVGSDTLKMAEKSYQYLKGVEVMSISESDASFLGFMNQLNVSRQNIKAGRYLIMDAGKGTLDFSVIDYRVRAVGNGSAFTYESICRSGIVGAGNAITYAFLLDILRHIYRSNWNGSDERQIESAITDFIRQRILSTNVDEAELNKLMKSLETYKALYNNGELRNVYGNVTINATEFKDVTLITVINYISNLINNCCVLDDGSYQYTHAMIENLSRKVTEKLLETYGNGPEQKIDFVVFAGRGFKMRALREKVFDNLKQHYAGIEEKELIQNQNLTSATYKNLCLFVCHTLLSGKYNGRIIGVPSVRTKNQVVTDNFEEVNEAEQGSKMLNKICSLVGKPAKWVKGGIELIKLVESGSSIDEYDNDLSKLKGNSLNKILVYGKSVNLSASDRIVFSGFDYELPCPAGRVELFFNGREFIIRQDGSSYNFSGYVDLSGQNVFESTFPYCNLDANYNIPFPRKQANAHVSQSKQEQAVERQGNEKFKKDFEILNGYEEKN